MMVEPQEYPYARCNQAGHGTRDFLIELIEVHF